MRIMALDVGEKRIGVALSDPLGITAQGLTVLENSKDVMEKITDLCRRHQVGQLVVGLPRNMDNTLGPSAAAATAFSQKVAAATGLPVWLEDERLTTAAAERVMLAADASRRQRRQAVDKMAAVLILQSFLQRGGKND